MTKEQRFRLRLEVLRHYCNNSTPRCQCPGCSEVNPRFLTIEHLYGGGKKHRRILKKAKQTIYTWLKKNNFPPGYGVLCWNCNCGLSAWGKCPHFLSYEKMDID